MRKFSYLIIIAGVLVMLYPKASEWYNDRQQEKLLKEAEQAYSELAPSSEPDLKSITPRSLHCWQKNQLEMNRRRLTNRQSRK